MPQSLRLRLLDGQLLSTPQSNENTIAIVSASSTGAVNVVTSLGSVADVRETFGRGKLPQAMASVLATPNHGEVIGVRAASTAGVIGAVTSTGTAPPMVTATGAPYDDAVLRVEIVSAGALGVATFRYSLDYDAERPSLATWSPVRVTAATYLIAELGVTLGFAAGTYVVDNRYTAFATAPTLSNTSVTDAIEAIRISGRDPAAIIVLAAPGGAADTDRATALSGLFAAVAAKRDEFVSANKPIDIILEGPAPVATTTAGLTTWRAALSVVEPTLGAVGISVAIGRRRKISDLGEGSIGFMRNAAFSAAERISSTPVHEDLGSHASPPLRGIVSLGSVDHDQDATSGLSSRWLTTSAFPNGVYFSKGASMAPVGSDFDIIANHRVVLVKGWRAGFAALGRYKNTDHFLAASTGRITDEEAEAIDADLTTQLVAALVESGNASNARATVVRTTDTLATKAMRGAFSVRPKGYFYDIEFTIGMER